MSVYDYKNESLITTFTAPVTKNNGKLPWIDTTPETIEYNEASNQYKQYHSFTPGMYFNLKMNYYSQHQGNIVVHDEGNKGEVYGAYTKSKIRFVVNPGFPVTKLFDNGFANVNPDGANLFFKLSMQDQDKIQNIDFLTDGRNVYRDNQMVFPLMQKNQRQRMRGEYLILEYEFQNGNNKTIRFSAHDTEFRLSNLHPK